MSRYDPVSTNLENVVVGKILTVEPHPHAPALKVCKVELGRDVQMNVVCGAPNVKVGMKVAAGLVRRCSQRWLTHSERRQVWSRLGRHAL